MSTAHAAHDLAAPAKPPSLILTVVGGLAFLTLFLGMGLLFLGWGASAFKDVDAQRETERWKILEELNAAMKKTQEEGPAWVNKEKGIVRLSTEKAMQLELERFKGRKPKAGNVIETTPAAPPTPAPAGAAPAKPAGATAPAATPPAPAAAPTRAAN